MWSALQQVVHIATSRLHCNDSSESYHMGAQVQALLDAGSMEAPPTVFGSEETNAGVTALMSPLQDAWKVLYTSQLLLPCTYMLERYCAPRSSCYRAHTCCRPTLYQC